MMFCCLIVKVLGLIIFFFMWISFVNMGMGLFVPVLVSYRAKFDPLCEYSKFFEVGGLNCKHLKGVPEVEILELIVILFFGVLRKR